LSPYVWYGDSDDDIGFYWEDEEDFAYWDKVLDDLDEEKAALVYSEEARTVDEILKEEEDNENL